MTRPRLRGEKRVQRVRDIHASCHFSAVVNVEEGEQSWVRLFILVGLLFLGCWWGMFYLENWIWVFWKGEKNKKNWVGATFELKLGLLSGLRTENW